MPVDGFIQGMPVPVEIAIGKEQPLGFFSVNPGFA
jgi:hypothetical protein